MSVDVLNIRNLSISSRVGEILRGFDLKIQAGQLSALVGESGSGKTMAARAIMGLLPPGIQITKGTIEFDGHNITNAQYKQMHSIRGAGIGMVFQEPMVSLNPALSIGSQMAEGLLQHHRLSSAEVKARSIAMLERINITDPEACLRAYPHMFSGGMRQRIMLASVMMLKPRLLIADEPTTALDTLAQKEVLDLMVELAHESGTAVLLITHNLGLVNRYTQEMTVLKQGDVIERGATTELISHAQQPYTQKLVSAARRNIGVPKVSIAKEENVLIQAKDVVVIHRGAKVKAVDRVSLNVNRGETVAIVGGSGSGKTTFGRAILGLVPISDGKIKFENRDIVSSKGVVDREARLACQMVFQDPYSSLNPRQRIEKIISEPLRHLPKMSPEEKRNRVHDVLEDVGLTGLEKRFPHELSGGQRQRIAIARALVRRPAFIVADEPVSALDMTIQAQILKLFRSLQARYGFASLFISHDLSAVQNIAHRVVVMEEGKIVEAGPTSSVLVSPEHPYTRRLVEAAPLLDAQPAQDGD